MCTSNGNGTEASLELANPFLRLEPTSHPDFKNAVPERSDIGDYVDVPCFGPLSHRDRALGLRLGFGEPCLEVLNLRAELPPRCRHCLIKRRLHCEPLAFELLDLAINLPF